MGKFIFKRLLHLIPILLGITFLSFALMQTASGDVVDAMYENAGTVASKEAAEQKRAELGLDKPFIEQYGNWLGSMLRGDMGTSFVSGDSVSATFISKIPVTASLAFFSLILTFLISFPFGIIAAVNRNRFLDYFIRFFTFIGNSMPGFFVSLLLIYVFALLLNILPVIPTGSGIRDYILPAVTLTIAMSSKYTRQIRGMVLEELGKEYVTGARARGVSELVILYKNILRASLVPIVTLFSLSLGSLLGGTAIIESIFMLDGIGKLAIDAINMRDYPIIQAYVVWLAIIYVFINFVADIMYHYLDPRVRIGGQK